MALTLLAVMLAEDIVVEPAVPLLLSVGGLSTPAPLAATLIVVAPVLLTVIFPLYDCRNSKNHLKLTHPTVQYEMFSFSINADKLASYEFIIFFAIQLLKTWVHC